jgi:hypothetical protein
MNKIFFTILLLSTTLAIKIKIRTPKSSGGSSNTGNWDTSRSCNPIAPQIQIGACFSIYTEQLYSIFNDPINELLLVKHETQNVGGVNHRLIFRVRDKQTNDKLYIGMTLYVDAQGTVRVTGYLESFTLTVIVNALGFSNGRLFKYGCSNLNNIASMGFTAWARELIGGGSTSSQGSYQDDLGDFNQGGQFTGGHSTNAGGYPTNTGGYPTNTGGYPTNTGRYHTNTGGYHTNTGGSQTTSHDPFMGSDSPFEEKTINIDVFKRDANGRRIKILGSARPKTN